MVFLSLTSIFCDKYFWGLTFVEFTCTHHFSYYTPYKYRDFYLFNVDIGVRCYSYLECLYCVSFRGS